MPKRFIKRVTDDHIEQINAELSTWEEGLNEFFDRYDEYADAFRLRPPRGREQGQGLTNTRVAETLRATEAIATTWFRMITAADPWWELIRADTGLSNGDLYTTQVGLDWQMRMLKYKKKLLKVLRSTALFGTGIADEPWRVGIPGSAANFQGTDFVNRSLLQFAFNPHVAEIADSDYYTNIDYLTPARLRSIAKQAPQVWDLKAIEEAISEQSGDNATGGRDTSGTVRQAVRNRRERAGYTGESKMLEVITRYGALEGLEQDGGREMVVTLINGTTVVKAHPNPRFRRPTRIGSYVDFELEPLGYGVGRMGSIPQRQMDSNRNRVMDLITFGLYNMWLMNRNSGVKRGSFRIRPNGIIEGDDISDASLRPLRPLLEATGHGLALDSVLKGELQGATGATPNLQAATTGATATESSIAQNEGIRRLSVHSEILADDFVREHILAMNQDNFLFLDQDEPGFMVPTERKGPQFFHPRTSVKEVEVLVKTVTDKDFRPKRVAEMTAYATQVLIPLMDRLPASIDPIPFLQEAAKALGVNPDAVIRTMDPLEQELPLTAGGKVNRAASQSPVLSGGAQMGLGEEALERNLLDESGPEAFEGPLGEVASA